MKAYLDNGATTMVDREVLKAMLPFFAGKYGNPSSLHSFGAEAREAVEHARGIIARKINASHDEIIFTSGGSESNNMALFGIANKEKNHIITTKVEHHCVLNACRQLEKEGFNVTYLDVYKEGFADLKQLERSITDKTCLVTIMHANNEIGVINDIGKIGEICMKHNVPFHTDAVQSLTKVPIDVKKQNLSLASFSAHKIHGPKGIGALYVRKGIKLRQMIYGGEQEAGRRAGTENVPNIVGFARAVELAKEEHAEKMAALRHYFIEEVRKRVPDIVFNGSEKAGLCNNINISFKFSKTKKGIPFIRKR